MKVAPGLYRLELELAGGGQKLAAARPVQVFERRREAAAASSLTSVWDKSGAIRRWLADRRYSVRDGDAAQVRAGDLLVVGELPPGTDIKQIQAAVRRGGRAVILRPEAVFDAGETGGTPSRERQYSGLLEQIAGSWKPELRQISWWGAPGAWGYSRVALTLRHRFLDGLPQAGHWKRSPAYQRIAPKYTWLLEGKPGSVGVDAAVLEASLNVDMP